MNDLDLLPSPPYDPELAGSLTVGTVKAEPITADVVDEIQQELLRGSADARRSIEESGLVITDHLVDCADGHRIPVHHIALPGQTHPTGCIYYIHGGGMILGTPWDGSPDYTQWIRAFGISVVTVDYRLAPGWRAPVPVEDCYAGLQWVHDHAPELSIDPGSVIVAGISAGGGLAAGVCLAARDRKGPPILAQMLLAPMLDPRSDGDSVHQFPDAPWTREENEMAWRLLLGDNSAELSGYNAPASAPSLAGLPPAYLESGSAEIFRSEIIDYANRIWREGGVADLHVWAGGFHGFEAFPHAAVTQGASATLRNWLARMLGYSPAQAQ